ncbi:hypothetical protein Tco_0064891 [Tanacetum coccineum]
MQKTIRDKERFMPNVRKLVSAILNQFEVVIVSHSIFGFIQRTIKAHSDPVYTDLQVEDFAKRMVDLVNQRKKLIQGTWEDNISLKKLGPKASLKRFGEELQTKTPKRLKEDKDDESKKDESTMKSGKRRKQMARKATYKIIKQGEKGVYQIVREDGTDIVYINFGAMLKSISRDDLTELYRIVMNRYGMDGPEDKLEKGFWKCLRIMFEEPLSTDSIWSEIGQQKIISWRYYDTCRVHCLNLESMDVYMLSERKYPLSAEVVISFILYAWQGYISPPLELRRNKSKRLGCRVPRMAPNIEILPLLRVHFSQLGPLGLNKVITFKVLCRSMQIEPTVTLFRVFQTLCKQGDWFSFAKRHVPSPIYVAIDDSRHVAGSFSMVDMCRLSAHVIKLRDMPEGVLVLSGPTLQRLPFYCTPLVAVDAVISNPTLEDLVVGTPSSKILAKAEASQKRKASTSGATLSHVAKRTRSTLAQSSSSTILPSLFVGDSDNESDGDDDACVKIPLVTPLRSTAVIPSLGNQGWSSTGPAAEGPNTRDSQGKGIMADDAAAPSVDVVAGNYEFTREEWDAPYRLAFGVLTKEVFKDPIVCKTMVDQFPNLDEMVRVKALSED